MTFVEEIHAANAAYVNHRPKGQLPLPPARKVAIVTVSLSFSLFPLPFRRNRLLCINYSYIREVPR